MIFVVVDYKDLWISVRTDILKSDVWCGYCINGSCWVCRYHELFFMIDTCQAESMFQKFYSPNILAVASSRVGEDSLSVSITSWSLFFSWGEDSLSVSIASWLLLFSGAFCRGHIFPYHKTSRSMFLEILPFFICMLFLAPSLVTDLLQLAFCLALLLVPVTLMLLGNSTKLVCLSECPL